MGDTKMNDQQLYEDVKALHDALNDLLALFIVEHGTDYNCVEKALQALVRHPELPTTVGFAEILKGDTTNG